MTAALIIFGREVAATEGNVNGALLAWQIDADQRTNKISRLYCGQLWERVSA